jgi:hypothetical protein
MCNCVFNQYYVSRLAIFYKCKKGTKECLCIPNVSLLQECSEDNDYMRGEKAF